MLQKNEMLSPPDGPPAGPPAPEAMPATTRRPTRWPWILGAALVVVLAAAAVLWWLLDSTVSQDLYDETVAELAASEEASADAQADAAELQVRVEALIQENEELESAVTAGTEQVADLQRQIDAAETAARFLAYRYVTGTPDDVAGLLEGGFDTANADAILQTLGETETLTEWVEGSPWLMMDRAVSGIDDEALTAAWDRYQGAEVGSVEETVAAVEFEGRLISLILEPLSRDTDGLVPAGTAETDRVAELAARNEELQNRITSALAVAQFMAYRSLDYIAEDVAAMQGDGDTATADAVLRQLGETGTWIEWVEGGGWLNVGNSIAQIDDEALSAAWMRWMDAEIGSVEEMTAYAELEQRIAYLMLDALADR